MKVLYANIEDVMREAAARWTLVAYFFISTLFIIIFAAAANLDIVNGALASATLFGHDIRWNDTLEKLVFGFESIFSGVLFYISTFLAVFATAHLVPRMQEKGTIDLYLSRPVARLKLILSRYLAGLILAGSNIAYIVGMVAVIVMWKTHLINPRFVFGGLLILFVFAVLLAFAFLVGVVTSSTAVSIMSTYAVFFFGLILYVAHTKISALFSTNWFLNFVSTLYWIFPKTAELTTAIVAFVSGDQAPERLAQQLTIAPFLSTAAFGIVCLVLASWLFQRKEF